MIYCHSYITTEAILAQFQRACRSTFVVRHDGATRTTTCRSCIANYQPNRLESVDLLADIVEQARQPPVVHIPRAAAAASTQLIVPQQQRVSQQTAHDEIRNAADAVPTNRQGVTGEACVQQEQHNQSALPQRRLRPSQMDFDTMYQQLVLWKIMYLTAHVPRFCFDAPELGAWVRYMRKQYKDQQLEQWKAERLNLLEFEWELTDQDAKWHHRYHQLRRYQLLYGSTQIEPSRSSADHTDWMMIVRWLNKQARLLAKRKLSRQKQDMLQQLGVTLKLPRRLVHRTAQLQGLNGMERRKLRKKWKKLDMAAVEQQRQQRWQEWELRRQQQRQQQWIANRRLALLQDAGQPEAVTAAAAGVEQQQQQMARRQVWALLQQLQKHDMLPGIDENQHATALQGSSSSESAERLHGQAAQHGVEAAGVNAAVLQVHETAQGLQPLQQQQQKSQQPSSQQLQQLMNQQQRRLQLQQGDTSDGDATDVQQHPQKQQHQKALFWQHNRGGRRGRQQTRQEKWLSAQQGK